MHFKLKQIGSKFCHKILRNGAASHIYNRSLLREGSAQGYPNWPNYTPFTPGQGGIFKIFPNDFIYDNRFFAKAWLSNVYCCPFTPPIILDGRREKISFQVEHIKQTLNIKGTHVQTMYFIIK